MSEVVGPEGIDMDKYIRTLGVPDMARAHLKNIEQEELDYLTHYAAGVNQAKKQTLLM